MDDKSLEDSKRTASLDDERESETVLLDADALTKETLASATKGESDSYRDVLRKLSDASADAAETSGEFGAVFNVRALVGRTLAKKYEILERIGRGGMGTVFRAKDITLDRDVAVKVLNPSLSDDELSLNRFLREAKLVSRLKHPHAISLYEFGVEGSVPYLVMEFVEGASLEHLIMTEGPFDVVRTNSILQQVCSALISAHALGILHRDLKPDNIMVARHPDGSEYVQVLDFGMAKALGPESEAAVKVSSTGVPCGTPHYMSPELITAQDVDLRADIYALGIIAYQMLVGKTPFEDFSTVEILYHQFHTVPPLVTEANPLAKVSRGVEKAVAKALEKHPDDRFQTVEQFAQQFASYVAEDFIFVDGSQTPRVVEPYRQVRARARRFRFLRTPLAKFWFAWFVISVVSVAVIWSTAKFYSQLRYYTTLPLIHLEDALGYQFDGLRKVGGLVAYGTAEEAFNGANSRGGGNDLLANYVALGRNLDIRDKNGQSLLHAAVNASNAIGMQILLDAKINPSARNSEGITPLILAASKGATGYIYALVDAGAAIDATDDAGKTALMYASMKGHLSAMHALLYQGAAINLTDENGRSALMYAMQSGNPDVLRLLVDQGAALELRDSAGRTAMFWAAASGNVQLVKALLDRGAKADVMAEGSITPLMLAISKGHYRIAKVLIESGADPKRKNAVGLSIAEMVRLQGPEAYEEVFGPGR